MTIFAMSPAERVRAVLTFQPVDRLPVTEWAIWWDKTIDRWKTEGLPQHLGGEELQAYFGLDINRHYWFWHMDGSQIPPPEYDGAPRLSGMDDYLRYRQYFYLDERDF